MRNDPASVGDGFLEVDGIRVHYRAAGPPDAPAVVLFHHFYGNVTTWRHVQAALSEDLRVIAFDRVGFGETERPPRGTWRGRNPYTREMSARIALALLDGLGVGEAAMMGSSAGGTAALETYAAAPDRVTKLVLLSPAITGDVGAPPRARRVLRSAPLRWIGTRVVRRLAGEITGDRVARSWHDPALVTEQDVAAYADALRAEGWDRGLWEVLTAERPPDLRWLLPRIEVPTLVVGGASDRVVSPRSNRLTAAAIPAAELHLLPQVGHTPHEERPDLLLPVVRRFLTPDDHRASDPDRRKPQDR